MTNRRSARRYRKTSGRRVWVFYELNLDVPPETIAKIITAAGLEQARREADSRAPEDADQSGEGGNHA
ncbi:MULTISPECIES: hypothetical protein [unclassified Microbacterium]|uniref:hypothetical protein n=1 Tax=unclassified Microbacterium TaxID=2609290 RepID=UPI00365EDED8